MVLFYTMKAFLKSALRCRLYMMAWMAEEFSFRKICIYCIGQDNVSKSRLKDLMLKRREQEFSPLRINMLHH